MSSKARARAVQMPPRQVASARPLPERVLEALADGRLHTGSGLALRFALSRSAVWKAVGALQALGVPLESVPRQGYRWLQATPLLQTSAIASALPIEWRRRLRGGSVVWRTGSTNSDLLAAAPLAPGEWDFRLAEFQDAGRGRRERHWYAPPGGALCLSLGWCFPSLPPDAPALSLAIGTCVVEAVLEFASLPLQLKWPNDLLVGGGKLGGILLELRAEAAGAAQVVAGVGLNVALPPELRQRVAASGTRAVDLADFGLRTDRNLLAASLLAALCRGLERFGRDGFAAFAERWRGLDALSGKAVAVSDGQGQWRGHARGVDASGALCVQVADGLRRVTAGDVSVRAES